MEKIEKCDLCSREFLRKYVNGTKEWSQLNQISFWTDKKGWKIGTKKIEILCRPCLKEWRRRYADDFLKLVSTEKKNRFRAYLYNGLLDRKDTT